MVKTIDYYVKTCNSSPTTKPHLSTEFEIRAVHDLTDPNDILTFRDAYTNYLQRLIEDPSNTSSFVKEKINEGKNSQEIASLLFDDHILYTLGKITKPATYTPWYQTLLESM